MKRQIIYKVTSNYTERKLFDFLLLECKLSRRFCKAASKEKRLKLNGKNVPLGVIVQEGDEVIIIIERNESQNILPEPMVLDIVYEDSDLILINKPPFVLVHPTKNHENGTLANGLMYHFKQGNDSNVVRFISRLDRDTSGLILIAKNSFSHMRLAKAMEENAIKKQYLGIIDGHLSPREGIFDLPIGKLNVSDINYSIVEGGKPSITRYKTLEDYELGSLVELELVSGRTHQIRVHLSSSGHTLMGDTLYIKQSEGPTFMEEIPRESFDCMNRQALHAYKLSFPHPRSEEELSFSVKLPADMEKQLERLGQLWEKK